ncbi:MAG: hypothetical protein HUU21_04015 [Polyangiaceae bacterium]|nr:hypothetical protein [Polyangiaceae bacterium]NUQ72700.1 hypothetical protein [Polyangiaceae bacterium]
MPEFRRSLDVYQGYNYKKDKQTPVGFITKLKIGTVELVTDQKCKDPMNPTNELAVVAVLSGVLWEVGVTDAVYFSGQISTANKQSVALMVINALTNIETVFQFSVYDYDPLVKEYFLSFQSNSKDMNGLVEKRGDDLNISVADDPSTEVQSPENYAFQIGIKPQPSAQDLHLATGKGKNFVKSWGLKVG